MENNNTKDVTYFGAYDLEYANYAASNKRIQSVWNCPKMWTQYAKNTTLLFDCSGTRYGFRIKTLKTK